MVNGWHETVWGHYFPLDVALSAALAADFDAILVPGGDRSIDKLKGNPHATRFVRGFVDGEKPVVAVGRGVDLLVAADRASGRRVAAFAGQDDALREAGAIPVDEPVVIDGPLITARDDVDVGVLKGEIVRQFVELAGAMAAAA